VWKLDPFTLPDTAWNPSEAQDLSEFALGPTSSSCGGHSQGYTSDPSISVLSPTLITEIVTRHILSTVMLARALKSELRVG
jgi:hypothetical protein